MTGLPHLSEPCSKGMEGVEVEGSGIPGTGAGVKRVRMEERHEC